MFLRPGRMSEWYVCPVSSLDCAPVDRCSGGRVKRCRADTYNHRSSHRIGRRTSAADEIAERDEISNAEVACEYVASLHDSLGASATTAVELSSTVGSHAC